MGRASGGLSIAYVHYGWQSDRDAEVIATFGENAARSIVRDYGVDSARVQVVGAGANVFPDVAHRRYGPVDLGELAGTMCQTTVFALPTLHEPFGIAFLDAMACGVPCVGTRTEAVPEIVREGETGLLVPPGDPVSLAAALERLLSDPALARAMGARGRARVFAGALWSHVAERLERTLVRAFSSRGRAA